MYYFKKKGNIILVIGNNFIQVTVMSHGAGRFNKNIHVLRVYMIKP